GYIAISGQIVYSTLVAAPKQRNSEDEKAAIKQGKPAAEIWSDKPAKPASGESGQTPSVRERPRTARGTIQFGKARVREDGKTLPDIAIPSFGSKAHTSINRRHRLIRRWNVTDADDGRVLRHGLLDTTNTGSGVWAASRRLPAIACQPTDSAYNIRRLVQIQRAEIA
ncbi:MAG: hypothetical protein AAFU49_21355, partial [Pseudomonadota bacterium]